MLDTGPGQIGLVAGSDVPIVVTFKGTLLLVELIVHYDQLDLSFKRVKDLLSVTSVVYGVDDSCHRHDVIMEFIEEHPSTWGQIKWYVTNSGESHSLVKYLQVARL